MGCRLQLVTRPAPASNLWGQRSFFYNAWAAVAAKQTDGRSREQPERAALLLSADCSHSVFYSLARLLLCGASRTEQRLALLESERASSHRRALAVLLLFSLCPDQRQQQHKYLNYSVSLYHYFTLPLYWRSSNNAFNRAILLKAILILIIFQLDDETALFDRCRICDATKAFYVLIYFVS